MWIAHKSEDGTRVQPLKEHLERVAERSAGFAAKFEAEETAYQLGLAHDIGKYSIPFQKRIEENGPKVDHSTAGAVELKKLGMLYASICAAGHHTGLPDLGTPGDPPGEATWCGRVGRSLPPYGAFREEIELRRVQQESINDFSDAFFVRMLFSALVDADYLDTETFMRNGAAPRKGFLNLPELYEKLENHLKPWLFPNGKVSEINRKRTEILKSCLAAAEGKQGIYSLTVPTGGGKTVSSLAFALRHALKNADNRTIDRIIYVVPYTSIIDQTVKTFRSILGKENVLEHHSNVDFGQRDDSDLDTERLRLAAENWDAPVIVTTSVQFFESLYANKSSRCRKLHNIANSVVVFDEAQMIPVDELLPCVRAIEELAARYHVTAVLCTATQPSLEKFLPAGLLRGEICPNREELYSFFRRNRFEHIGAVSQKELAGQMAQNGQVLTIVDTRKQAFELFQLLPEEGRFHLSTLMTPVHRMWTLRCIRRRLQRGLSCRVAATSLVEAGVDLDFPSVFRAEAGLDSIIQAAGRCNREMKLPELGRVLIYRPEDKTPPRIAQNVSLTKEVMQCIPDLSSPEAIERYFNALHKLKAEYLDKKGILKATESGIQGCLLPFSGIGKCFRLIDTDTKCILIPNGMRAGRIAERLRRGEFSRSMLRQAGRYEVNVYEGQFAALRDAGDIEIVSEGLAILTNTALYDMRTGLSLEADPGKGLFV